jgi:tetratricopeptide (TPR) repeat protein
VNLGGLLLGSGRTEEALRHNRLAAEARPADATAAAQLGMNLFQLGRYDDAEPYLAAAKRLDPAHHTQPQLFLAEIYRRRGDAAAAIRELEELLALRPSGANATAVRGALARLRPADRR